MLIENLFLERDTDGTWLYNDLNFACPEAFDWLFGISPDRLVCELFIYDEQEDDCKQIFIEPITDEEQENAPIIDYDLFYCGTRLTKHGTYSELRRRIKTSSLKNGGTIWVKVE